MHSTRSRAFRTVDFIDILPLAVLDPGRPIENGLLARDAAYFRDAVRHAVNEEPVRLTERFVASVRRGLAARLLDALERWDITDLCDETVISPLRAISALYAKLAVQQQQCGGMVLDEFASAGIRAALLKSYDLLAHSSLDGTRDVRYDIDLLIEESDYQRASEILTRGGWVQGELVDGRITPVSDYVRQTHGRRHYEWWPFIREGPAQRLPEEAVSFAELAWPFAPGAMTGRDVRTIIALDLHRSVDASIPAEAVWRHVHEPSPSRSALTPEASVWLLSGRLYHETMVHAGRKFRQMGQLLGLVGGSVSMNWDAVSALADEFLMQPALYYTMETIRRFWGLGPDSAVLERCAGSFRNQYHLRDFGDMVPALLDLERVEELHLAGDEPDS